MSAVSDSCALLDRQALQQLDIDDVKPDGDTGSGQPGCTYFASTGPPYMGYTVTPKPDFDTSVVDGYRGRDLRVVSAAGFPAVESRLGASNISCFVNVDVADGQSLEVQSLLNSTDMLTADQLCELTRQVAEAAMTTLLGRS